MRDAEKILRGAVQTFSGQIAGQVFSLIRNLIVARVLVPEDFGIAATFAITLSALDMLSDLSFHKIIVQFRDGQSDTFQRLLQTLNALRGVLLALLLFASAGWVARIFDIPEATGSFQLLALAPLMRGLVHLDLYRFQRSLTFSGEVITTLLSQFVGLIVAVVLVWITRHFDAVLWAVLAQAAVFVLCSHWFAVRPFRLGLDRTYLRETWDLSWPLMVNGMIIMLATQADRILVGAELGLRELAFYTVATLLTTTGGFLLTKMTATLGIPWMSSAQDNPALFESRYELMGHIIGVVSVAAFVPLIFIGPDLIAFLFGTEYQISGALVGWLSLAACLRYMRARMNSAAFAAGDAKNLMISNMVRIVGLLLAVVLVRQGGDAVAVAMAMAFGEAAGLVVSIWRLKATANLPRTSAMQTTCITLAALLAALSLMIAVPDLGLLARLGLSALLPLIAVILSVLLSPALLRLTLELPGMLMTALGLNKRTAP